MRSKEELLRMSKYALLDYKWDDDLDSKNKDTNYQCSACYGCRHCKNCDGCFESCSCVDCVGCIRCVDCFSCHNCQNCSNCFACRNLEDGEKHEYKICNVQFTKEEYEKKMAELKED